MIKIPMSINETFWEELQKLKKNYSYSFMSIANLQPKQLDFVGYVADFCNAENQVDYSADGSSNVSSKDIVTLENEINKPMFKMMAFNKIYLKLWEKYGRSIADNWLKSEYLGNSYLHDACSSTFIPYCYAYDLTKLANEGLFFLSTHSSAPYNNIPAAHLDTFVNHIKEFVSFCCNRQAGAVGLPNLLPWMYYFWLKDIREGYNGCHLLDDGKIGIEDFSNVDYNEQNIKYFSQCTQSLIYALNQPYLRNSIQSAFTNVSIFDHNYAHSLFDGMVFPNGELAYDHIDNIVELQKLFLTIISDKIRPENMFTFPVLTICLLTSEEEVLCHSDGTPATEEEIESFSTGHTEALVKTKVFKEFKDPEFARWASDHNTKWFDSNFFLSSKVTSLSNCCRLASDISSFMNEEGYFNSIGGSGLSVGSVKVNTINLARIAYESVSETRYNENEDYLYKLEKTYLDKVSDQIYLNLMCLDVVRDIIIDNKDKRHLLPNITDGLIDMKHMYNTIGIIGIYETLKAFQNRVNELHDKYGFDNTNCDYITYDTFGNAYYTKKAEDFVRKIFEQIKQEIKFFKNNESVNYSINCEQVPAETCAKKLMQKDELLYPDLVVKDLPLYGNQFIPLGIKTTLEERIRVAALFDKFLDGGSIAHLNFESTLDKEKSWTYLNWVAKQELTYSAFTTKISVCEDNHAFFGDVCPHCGKHKVTEYARIVGFYVPVSSYSSARKQEFELRQWEG